MLDGPVAALRNPDLEAEVAALYSDKLAYHNFQHALDTIAAADGITQKCIDEGIRVDAEVVYYALLFHDAGFLDDHHALGFETKEAYAADLAQKRLTHRGTNESTINKVVDAILSTHKDASFVTAEQKAVRAADLSGLAADYETFVRNSANLKTEYELFHARELDWREWVDNASGMIRFYLSQEIRLTSFFSNKDGDSRFHVAVRDNLNRLEAESYDSGLG